MSVPPQDGRGSRSTQSWLGLGELEMAVLEVLWQADDLASVRDVQAVLHPHRELAYTTLQTVLEKLRRKGWAEREPMGRAFHYRAARSREEVVAHVLHSLLTAAPDVDAALLHFVDQVSSREQDVLRAALQNDRGRGSEPRDRSGHGEYDGTDKHKQADRRDDGSAV